MWKLKKIFHHLKEHFGFCFYTKPQRYRARYEVTVRNLTPENNFVWVVLPAPSDTESQHLQERLAFLPEPRSLGKEGKFGNQYGIWEVSLPPNATQKIEEKFTISVLPRRFFSKQRFSLQDYVGAMTSSEYALYLTSNQYLQADDPHFKELAQDLSRNTRDILEIVSRCNEYTISSLAYGNPIPSLYTAREALNKKVVDCGGFDTLLATLCIVLGIPTRIVSGFWAGYKKNEMHAWVEVLLPNGAWFPADPSVQYLRRQGRTSKLGALGVIGSDRIAMSVGCDIPIEVQNRTIRVYLLQNPIVFAEKGEGTIEVVVRFITSSV